MPFQQASMVTGFGLRVVLKMFKTSCLLGYRTSEWQCLHECVLRSFVSGQQRATLLKRLSALVDS